jgi:hypothetical protein
MNSLIDKITDISDAHQNPKVLQAINQLKELVVDLNHRALTMEIIDKINSEISLLNTSDFSRKSIQKTETNIFHIVETHLNLVSKGHYRRKWLALGMTTFGIPIGVIFGLSVGNIGLLGVGLPLGLCIGIIVGNQKDKKAFQEGRQLAV